MKKTIFAHVVLALQSLSASFIINEGEFALGEFKDMRSGVTNGWIIDYGTDSLASGESFRFRVYEDSYTEIPILDRYISNSRPTNQSGFIFFGIEENGHFPDRQGLMRIDMQSGSLELESIYFSTDLQDGGYNIILRSFDVIPEPSTLLSLTLASLSFLLIRHRRHPETRIG